VGATTGQGNAQGLSGGGLLDVSSTCFSPSAPATPIDCHVASNFAAGIGNQVTVTVKQPFAFLTPFIGSLFGGSVTLTTSATAPVFNPKVASVPEPPPPGVLDHLVLSPANVTLTLGQSQTYTAEGFDASNNDLGNVTAATTFTLSPATGSCTGAVCTPTAVGVYTVTGTDGAALGTTSLTVAATPPVCVPPTVTITYKPKPNSQEITIETTFSATVTNGPATEWAWDFGAGQLSDLQSPTYTFTYTLAVKNGHPNGGPQTWPVSLTVTATPGCTGTGTTTVTLGG
jgi:PKD repeat protein